MLQAGGARRAGARKRSRIILAQSTPPCAVDPYEESARMDALTLLRRDHREVKKLLAELEPTTDRAVRTRTRLYDRLKTALTAHEMIEEEIFYPALREHPRAKEIVLEAYEEHNVVDSLLGELGRLPVTDQTWGAKAKVMAENLTHHIEEEEREMFGQARRLFDTAELADLGRRMEERKASALRTIRSQSHSQAYVA
jgi:hemerythrin-like domain-containing protein